MQFFPTVDEDVQYFRSEGYTGSIDDMHYAALGDLGYSGALTDRLRAYLLVEFGSYYEAMRDLRNGTSVFALLSYRILTLDPALVLDFDATYYRVGGSDTDLVSAATHTRSSTATYVDASGILQTAGVNVPRVGHHLWDGAAWVDAGYFHESEARTNLVTYSNGFADAYWVLDPQLSTPTQGPTGPDGEASAWTIVDNASGGSGFVYLDSQNITVSNSTPYTASVFAKSDQISGLYLQVNSFTTPANGGVVFDLDAGSVGTADAGFVGQIQKVGSGWYRCSITFTTDAADTSGKIRIGLYEGSGSIPVDGTSSILIYGAQLEAGSTPSSYIPTAGSTVTRAADTMTIPAVNMPWSGTAVSIQMDGTMTGVSRTFAKWTLDASNEIMLQSGASNFTFTQEAGGVVDTVIGGSFTSGINVPFNIASRHGSTFLNGAVDGTALTADLTPVALPDLSATDMQVAPTFMGTIKQLRVWAADITDTGIAGASA